MPTTQTRGEVLMLTNELLVVKSSDGTNILIPPAKDTIVDSTVKIGQQVEIPATPAHHIISVKRLDP